MYRCACLGLKDEDFTEKSEEELLELFESESCCGGCEQELELKDGW